MKCVCGNDIFKKAYLGMSCSKCGLVPKNVVYVPLKLLDMNTIIKLSKQGKGGYQPYAIKKREQQEVVSTYIKQAKVPAFNRIDLELVWTCKNARRDKDNISAGVKIVLDSLVDAGVIVNDGWKQIGKILHDWKVTGQDGVGMIIRPTIEGE